MDVLKCQTGQHFSSYNSILQIIFIYFLTQRHGFVVNYQEVLLVPYIALNIYLPFQRRLGESGT